MADPSSGDAATPRALELRRLGDGLIYRFAVAGTAMAPDYVRADGAVLIQFVEQIGWAACDSTTGDITGLPWAVPLAQQSRHCPPAGAWVSRKGERSYPYELHLISEPQ